ncbi:MAG: M12 family metallo-peptidase [Bacteroidota bacterium]
MKYIKSMIVILVSLVSSITISAKTIDAELGITFLTSFNATSVNDAHSRNMVVESVWSDITFKESGSAFTIENFPISLEQKGTISLTLVPSTVDATTELFIGTQRFPIPDVRTYTGHIMNEPGSSLLITHASGELSGWIERANGSRVFISPINDENRTSHHMLYDEYVQGDIRSTSGSCMTDESSITIPKPEDLYSYFNKTERVLANNLLELQIIPECTSAFFNGPGRKDSIKTAEFMIGLMNGVNALYRRELNVAVIIPRLQIWTATTPDPYTKVGNAPALLNEVVSRWSKITNVERDIVHCLDAVPTQSGLFVLGIANDIGNVCSGGVSNAYSVAGIFKNGLVKINDYLSDIVTVAHEIGHNIGSYHTHNCTFWPPRGLDSCMTSGTAYRSNQSFSQEACYKGAPMANPGSIMSYCHLTNPTKSVAFSFLPRVSTYLRTYLESRPCVTAATKPVIRMIYPWGQQTLIIGEQTNIEWTSYRVNNVNIEMSTDGGITWRTIFVSRPAVTQANGTGLFKWTIPDNPTTKGRLRIIDASNDQVKDTSWADFAIAKPTLTLNTDLRTKKYGQKERVNLSWTKELIDKTNIEFSSNGGSTWTLIADSTSSSSMTVDIPDIESTNCYFRVLDITRKVMSQSGPFEVGKESLTLLYPKNEDSLCIGTTDTMKWTSQFMLNSKIFLEYRTIGQSTWKRISSIGHDAVLGSYAWNLSALTEGVYQFRATYRQDTSLATSPIVIAITSQGKCAKIAGIEEDHLLSIFPNPAKEIITVQHIPIQCEMPSIIVSDVRGKTIQQSIQLLNQTKQSLELSVKSLPNGQYYVNIICGTYKLTAPFTINR